MKRYRRDETGFNLSAVDLFCSALGAVIILTIILFPFYGKQVRVESLEIVFVVDTTGSMGDQVADLRDNLDHIVVALHRLCSSLQVGAVAYKDDSSHSEYRTLAFPMRAIHREEIDGGRSFEALRGFFAGLSADGGDNIPYEDMDVAMDEAMAMGWSAAAVGGGVQIIVVVADVGPPPDRQAALLASVSRWVAEGRDRRLIAIFTHPNPEREARFYPYFESLAEAAGSRGIAHRNSGRLLGSILDIVIMR